MDNVNVWGEGAGRMTWGSSMSGRVGAAGGGEDLGEQYEWAGERGGGVRPPREQYEGAGVCVHNQ